MGLCHATQTHPPSPHVIHRFTSTANTLKTLACSNECRYFLLIPRFDSCCFPSSSYTFSLFFFLLSSCLPHNCQLFLWLKTALLLNLLEEKNLKKTTETNHALQVAKLSKPYISSSPLFVRSLALNIISFSRPSFIVRHGRKEKFT
jgi:hypothetical protein